MARNGVVSGRWWSDEIDGFDFSPSDNEEVHVLAVDDSLVDRKVIERLLRISSCKGLSLGVASKNFNFVFEFFVVCILDIEWNFGWGVQ